MSVEPLTGLTPEEKVHIQESWIDVKAHPTERGVEAMLLYIRRCPEIMQLFPFRDIPYDKLAENARFRAHSNSVIYRLTAMVDALDTPEVYQAILAKTGEAHTSRNVTEKIYWGLKPVLLEYFALYMTPAQMDAWKKALDVAFVVMIDGLKAGKK